MDLLLRANRFVSKLLLGVVIIGLANCQRKEEMIPQGARIQIVLRQNQQLLPLYFLEDSARSQLSLDVYYFDENNSFVNPPLVPVFLVNGEPITGNLLTLKNEGQFTVTAQVGNRRSDNELIVNVGSVNNIRSFTIQAIVPWLNADSTSRLPLFYELIDKQGHSLKLSDYPSIKLFIDGTPQADPAYISTSLVGTHALQADFLGRKSAIFRVTARQPLRYDVVQLPVIIHILAEEDASKIDPTAILAEVNRTFRRRKRSVDPNQADAYIEFVPALSDPEGAPLAVAGLDRLSFGVPSSLDTAVSRVHRVVQRWCPQQYINVFVSLDWQRTYGPGYSYSYSPSRSTNSVVSCETIRTVSWRSTGIPAIYIYDTKSFSSLDHELGHFLGLGHTFTPGCSSGGGSIFTDLPHHDEARPDAKGLKYSCGKVPFISEYTMDYYVPHNGFTYDQVSHMREMLTLASYLPSSAVGQLKRRVTSASGDMERGSIID